MTQVYVDLNTRIIPATRQVYVARPGKNYRLYPEVIASKSILVELPALDLTEGLPVSEHLDLDARIRRSKALRKWYREVGASQKEKPDIKLASYTDSGDYRSINQLKGIVIGYFEKLQVGDLVIVPPSAYSSPAYIGEIISEPHRYVRTAVPRLYGDDRLTGRQVKWLAGIQKRRLPDKILEAVEKPGALYLVERSVRKSIYEAAYHNFAFSGTIDEDITARFEVSESKFSTLSDIQLQAFFQFVSANLMALKEGRNAIGINDAIFESAGIWSPDLRTNINSPGFLTLVSKAITPLVAAALLALAIEVGSEAVNAAENGHITIGNSLAPPGDACTADVIKSTLLELQLLGLDHWPRACEIARKAAESTGIKGSVKTSKR